METTRTTTEKNRSGNKVSTPIPVKSLVTRWGDGFGGKYVKVPVRFECTAFIGKYRREVGPPMATYFAPGGKILAYQWHVPGAES